MEILRQECFLNCWSKNVDFTTAEDPSSWKPSDVVGREAAAGICFQEDLPMHSFIAGGSKLSGLRWTELNFDVFISKITFKFCKKMSKFNPTHLRSHNLLPPAIEKHTHKVIYLLSHSHASFINRIITMEKLISKVLQISQE